MLITIDDNAKDKKQCFKNYNVALHYCLINRHYLLKDIECLTIDGENLKFDYRIYI